MSDRGKPSVPVGLKRSVQIGRLGIGMAAGKALRGTENAQALVTRLGTLHGLPQKIAQILSLAESNSDSKVFTPLTNTGVAMPLGQVQELVSCELGKPHETVFSSIDPEAYAASIGQVHRAQLLDGRVVALKIQYPGISQAIEQDLRSLGWLATPLSLHASGFDLDSYKRVLGASISRELDYSIEAASLQRFTIHCCDCSWLRSPTVLKQYSTKKMLVMSWEEGVPFSELLLLPRQQREQIASRLVELVLRSWFIWRDIHADLHEGNLLFNPGEDSTITLLDLGCVRTVSSDEVRALKALFEATPDLAVDDAFAIFCMLGFDQRVLAGMRERLPAIVMALSYPFQQPGMVSLTEWNLRERLSDALGPDRHSFRFAGPAEIILLIRSLSGLLAYVRALDVPVPWQALYRSVCDEVSLPEIAPAPVQPALSVGPVPCLADVLRIRVSKQGKTKVQLTFRSAVLKDLPALMDDDVLAAIERQGIDIHALCSTAVSNGCPPGELFTSVSDESEVKVWLE